MAHAVASAVLVGNRGYPVWIRAQARSGRAGIRVDGLPGEQGVELAGVVDAALSSSGLRPSASDIRLHISDAPWGDGLDLAAAVAVLVAVGELSAAAVAGIGFAARLGLDGSVRPLPGALPRTEAVEAATVVVARANAAESALADGRRVVPVDGLGQLVAILKGTVRWPPPAVPVRELLRAAPPSTASTDMISPVAGAALVVAAAGRHHVSVHGLPGRARAVARCLADVLPPPPAGMALELARVRSAAGLRPTTATTAAPWREVRPSSSATVVAGGAGPLRPGEASLAHGGVLLLDRVERFDRGVLRVLGEAVRSGTVTVARGRLVAVLAADVQLVVTTRAAPVSGWTLPRWLDNRLSVRIDAASGGPCVPWPEEATVSAVAEARRAALARGWPDNESIPRADLRRLAPLSAGGATALESAVRAGTVSAGAADAVWRVARTVADLAGRSAVVAADVEAALGMRGGRALSDDRVVRRRGRR